jgi:hypothetical protein
MNNNSLLFELSISVNTVVLSVAEREIAKLFSASTLLYKKDSNLTKILQYTNLLVPVRSSPFETAIVEALEEANYIAEAFIIAFLAKNIEVLAITKGLILNKPVIFIVTGSSTYITLNYFYY